MELNINDLFSFNFTTYHKILEVGGKNGPEALALYIRYIEQVKMQNQDETFSLDKFMMSHMRWNKNKFYKIKKILMKLSLIEQIKWQWWEAKVKVNFIISENFVSDVLKNGSSEVEAIESQNPDIPKIKISKKPVVLKIKTQNNKEYINKIINNNNSNELLENPEQKNFSSYKISDSEIIENSDDELEKKNLDWESEKKSSAGEPEVEKLEEKVEYWKKEINITLAFLRQSVGVSDFKESQKMQRILWKHIYNLFLKIGKDEFALRLKLILQDSFKAKNSNSLNYLYKELKAFIHSPVVPTVSGKKEVTFW